MPTGYQIKDQATPHYLTFQVVYWIDLFSRQVYRDIIVNRLKYCQREKDERWIITNCPVLRTAPDFHPPHLLTS